ncbi:YdeI/OmpD-associated family protein [Fundicoccus sp. Sow4_H7]|uniref:YdeI/OmpD-associated family protein n=1 Tax=Fundicoccus sp. Sow4_H7 TaxID=3438784 RepID=UPI003F8EBCE7
MVDVKTFLADYPEQLGFFQELTAGYQKGWAPYVFSAKQQKTKDDRKTQMIDI